MVALLTSKAVCAIFGHLGKVRQIKRGLPQVAIHPKMGATCGGWSKDHGVIVAPITESSRVHQLQVTSRFGSHVEHIPTLRRVLIRRAIRSGIMARGLAERKFPPRGGGSLHRIAIHAELWLRLGLR